MHTQNPSVPSDQKTNPDSYLWLEDVEGAQALEFVTAQNTVSKNALHSDERFLPVVNAIRKILGSKDKLPSVNIRGEFVYNFWQDEVNPRGLWRRALLGDYLTAKAKPQWEVLLDIDELSRSESQSWFWQRCEGHPPEYSRFLLSLSRGGKDARVTREFDIKSKSFVTNHSFDFPESKSSLSWYDNDTVLLAPDEGGNTVTDSGYPRTIRSWKRGENPRTAPEIFAGEKSDVYVWSTQYTHGAHSLTVLARAPTFFTSEFHVLLPDFTTSPIHLPKDAQILSYFRGDLVVSVRFDWNFQDTVYSEGTVFLFDVEKNIPKDILFVPTHKASVTSVEVTKNAIVLNLLDNIHGRIVCMETTEKGWISQDIPLPQLCTSDIVSATDTSDQLLLKFESFLVPPRIYSSKKEQGNFQIETLITLPHEFDSSKYETLQCYATSPDGTLVPYFMVQKRGLKLQGNNPTLLNGYGGFANAKTPLYSGSLGTVWLEMGGVYVVANIRGGNEYGPKWHHAALYENRQRSYDDFIAVAEHLVTTGVTSPRHLGIQGGSNGGLLVGAVMVQRPDLFNAVLCQVPLLDMLRFHKLLAGASWMDEYGNPDEPGIIADAIRKYSPYQNVKTGVKYPKIFLRTSTRDDRVHPGHARKMAALMLEQGHDVLFFENMEGGHAGAADHTQRAEMSAMDYVFLMQQLM
jgi:prolyl oligopeptidase